MLRFKAKKSSKRRFKWYPVNKEKDFHWNRFYIYWLAAWEKAAGEAGIAVVAEHNAAAESNERAEAALAKIAGEEEAKDREAASDKTVGESPAAAKVAAEEATNDAKAARAP